MTRRLQVTLHDSYVGVLTQTNAGRLEFEYDPTYVAAGGPPLSIALPVRAGLFDQRACEPYFGGLLPEEGVRERIARFLGITANNDFALLERIGGECAGAVTLEPLGNSLPTSAVAAPSVLTDEQLARLLDELPRRPLLVGGEVRLSLAGAQDKAAVTLVRENIALPASEPSTHILKTPIARFEGTVANELLVMRTATRLGLRVAEVQRRVVLGREFLLVTRFDRELRDGRVVRLHQEDTCQALGRPTRVKYQAEGGPALPELFELLTRHAVRPAIDRLMLLRATIFNVLIGNADAHAKNFSLLHVPRGVALAPFYDLLSTLVYSDLSPRYAMKIGSKATFEDIRPPDWDAFADASGLAKPQVRRALAKAAAELPRALAAEIAALPPELAGLGVVAEIARKTELRCEATRQRLAG
jgi:serine/threonine-protein kinase HipA